VLIEAKDDGDGGDNWTTGAIIRAKLQSNHHHQQTNTQFFYRPDALPVAHPTVSKCVFSLGLCFVCLFVLFDLFVYLHSYVSLGSWVISLTVFGASV